MQNKYVINKNFVSAFFLVALVILIPFLKGCSQSRALEEQSNALNVQRQMVQHRLDMREQKTRENHFLAEMKSSLAEHKADVFRQGDILVIRLKELSFPSTYPEVDHLDHLLLSKVKNVIEEHTDSSVGNFLKIKTDRLGHEKPLAINTTSTGGAQNRRVEIFIFSRDESGRRYDTDIQREGWPLL